MNGQQWFGTLARSASHPTAARPGSVWVYASVASIGVAIHAGFALAGTRAAPVDDWLYCSLFFLAFVACADRGRRDGGGPWVLGAVGVLVWGSAEIVFRAATPNSLTLYPAATQAMLFVAFQIDHRTEEDYAFWLYFFGMLDFWGALSSMSSDSEPRKIGYCALNLGFVVLSVLLRRRVFLVFGALGVNAYLVHLAWRVFEKSMVFPFVLTLLGLAIISAAVYYQRNRAAIELRIEGWVPLWLRELLPPARMAAR